MSALQLCQLFWFQSCIHWFILPIEKVDAWIRGNSDVREGEKYLRKMHIFFYLQTHIQCELCVPWSACWGVTGQDAEPRTAPDMLVGTLHGSHRHQCINYCESLWTQASAKCECKSDADRQTEAFYFEQNQVIRSELCTKYSCGLVCRWSERQKGLGTRCII